MWFDSRPWKHNFVLRKRLRLAPGTSEPPVRRVLGRAGKEAKRETDHSPMFSKVLKKKRRYINPLPDTTSWSAKKQVW